MTEDLDKHFVRSAELEALTTLLRGICHEMNNPLTGILGYSQLLLSTMSGREGDALDDVRHIEMCARRMQTIIERLTSLLHPDRAPARDILIKDLMRDVQGHLEYFINRYFIKLQVDLTPDLPAVSGRYADLRLALQLILLRAVKAMQESGGSLAVAADMEGSQVRIRVRDNGPALSAQEREDLLILDAAADSVGLPVARSILQEHGGDLTTSTDNGWNQITLVLPAHTP